MSPTDTSEKELERIIPDSFITQSGYVRGGHEDFDRDHAVYLPKFQEFSILIRISDIRKKEISVRKSEIIPSGLLSGEVRVFQFGKGCSSSRVFCERVRAVSDEGGGVGGRN